MNREKRRDKLRARRGDKEKRINRIMAWILGNRAVCNGLTTCYLEGAVSGFPKRTPSFHTPRGLCLWLASHTQTHFGLCLEEIRMKACFTNYPSNACPYANFPAWPPKIQSTYPSKPFINNSYSNNNINNKKCFIAQNFSKLLFSCPRLFP